MKGERKRDGGKEMEGRGKGGRKARIVHVMNDLLLLQYHSGLVWGCVCQKLLPVPGWQPSPPRRVPAGAGARR